MSRGPAVPMMGIWLLRSGDYAVVLAEKPDGSYVELLREHIEGPFSHNITEHGIAQLFAEGKPKSVQLL